MSRFLCRVLFPKAAELRNSIGCCFHRRTSLDCRNDISIRQAKSTVSPKAQRRPKVDVHQSWLGRCVCRLLLLLSFLAGAFPCIITRKFGKSHLLHIIWRKSKLLLAPAKENSFCPFPCFDTQEEKQGFHEDNAPFPRNPRMFEYAMIDHLRVVSRGAYQQSQGKLTGI